MTVPLLLISPLPNGGRGRAPYPSVGLEGSGGGGIERESVGLEEPAMRLSFRADAEMYTCHFEPVTQLSFRAEGEKS